MRRFGMIGFGGGRKAQKTPGKILGERTKTNNKLNPRLTPGPGFEPGRQQWFGPSFWH